MDKLLHIPPGWRFLGKKRQILREEDDVMRVCVGGGGGKRGNVCMRLPVDRTQYIHIFLKCLRQRVKQVE